MSLGAGGGGVGALTFTHGTSPICSRKKEAEEDARLAKIVYVHKDMIPQPYSSETQEATMADVDSLSVKCSRPLIKISITRERREYGANCKFNDRDAEQCGLVECSEFWGGASEGCAI